MKRILNALKGSLPTCLLALGAVAVAGGIAMIYVPAGVITAGLLAILAGVLLIRGGGDADEQPA